MLTKDRFILRENLATLAASEIKNNKRVELDDGSRYLTSDVDGGNGVLLASGNYANPVTDQFNVIPQVGGGELTALRNNELQDSGFYTIPLASSVAANRTIAISQPDEFVINTPTVTASGSDTITDTDGSDTSILFDNAQSIEITLTSDGVSNWRL